MIYGRFCNVGTHCRFDAQAFLKRFKGKTIMFVGDSVSLNHYESFVCLLHAAVPDSTIVEQSNDSFSTMIFKVSELYVNKDDLAYK